MNTAGSYICSCREGFVLQKDKHSCKEGDNCFRPVPDFSIPIGKVGII